MSIGMWQMICASVVGVTLLVITLIRQRRFELPELGVLLAGFLGALPLPAGIVLYLYGFFPDPPHVQTKLQGLHLSVAAAGVLMFLVGLMTIWRLAGVAYRRGKPGSGWGRSTLQGRSPGFMDAGCGATDEETHAAEHRTSVGRS
jgi:hypothetical protein